MERVTAINLGRDLCLHACSCGTLLQLFSNVLSRGKRSKVPRRAVRNAPAGRGDFVLIPNGILHIISLVLVSVILAISHRKSEYCDEWMYWVAVKVKGTNKCPGSRLCVECHG